MYSRKRSKTSREGSSSGVALAKWEQPCTLPDIEDRFFSQNWDWSRFKDEEFGACWNENQNKPLCKFKNKQTEKKLWRYKMSKVTIDKVCVYERLVNAEEFKQIGITQKFERLGWERALDWVEDATSKHADEEPSRWKLKGETSKGLMVMSFQTMNRIANFDSLSEGSYTYYEMRHFWESGVVQTDLSDLVNAILPNYTEGEPYSRAHLSVEGKILQNISLENIMVRFGDRGKLRVWDLRVLHALLYGEPKLSWRHIVMMNIWDTRNQYKRKMIPHVRLISAMIAQQNQLPENSLWVLKAIDHFDFAKMRKGSKIWVEEAGQRYRVTDKDTGSSYMYPEEEGENEEMGEGDESEEGNEEEEDPGRQPDRQRRSKHKEISGFVANFIQNRQKNAYRTYNLGQQDVYDNVSAAIAEAREREERRMKSEEEWRNKQEEMWALTRAHWEQERSERAQEVARRRAWEQKEERLHVAREALEDRRWATLATEQQIHINNLKHLHDQERHHRNYMAGLPYQPHTPWTNYENLPVPPASRRGEGPLR
ncbi:hypothetical protein HanRHA438_Chr12g0565361 [Helianthus annuus]|nr:hypothetical protein HanLR1_Chr12g0456641 [Helianthus annuus]KAJ0863733.1 hypothetical protein HanPSC8_Chr12g0533471 [Helianthus annuus]KAJ0867627.1 hypothetical protein HanRHA438_Chr12g0565361 [Helianthus annuus]